MSHQGRAKPQTSQLRGESGDDRGHPSRDADWRAGETSPRYMDGVGLAGLLGVRAQMAWRPSITRGARAERRLVSEPCSGLGEE